MAEEGELQAAMRARQLRTASLQEPGSPSTPSAAFTSAEEAAHWCSVLRHFYKVHPPPPEWAADEWGDEEWEAKIGKIVKTYKKKATKLAQTVCATVPRPSVPISPDKTSLRPSSTSSQ